MENENLPAFPSIAKKRTDSWSVELPHNINNGEGTDYITYQQKEKGCSVCCRCDVLHEDTCREALCHATPCASNKYQTPQIQDILLN